MLCGFFESEPATLQRRERAQPHVPGAVSAHGPRPRASVRAFERNGHGIGRGHVRERFGRSPAKGSPAKRPTPAAQGATPGVCGQQCLLAVVRPRRGCRSGLATCTIPRSVRSLCTGHRAPFLSALPRAYRVPLRTWLRTSYARREMRAAPGRSWPVAVCRLRQVYHIPLYHGHNW